MGAYPILSYVRQTLGVPALQSSTAEIPRLDMESGYPLRGPFITWSSLDKMVQTYL